MVSRLLSVIQEDAGFLCTLAASCRNLNTMKARHFENWTAFVSFPFPLAACDWFDAVVSGFGGQPKILDEPHIMSAVKLGRDHNHVYVAPFMSFATRVRPIKNDLAGMDPVRGQGSHVPPNRR